MNSTSKDSTEERNNEREYGTKKRSEDVGSAYDSGGFEIWGTDEDDDNPHFKYCCPVDDCENCRESDHEIDPLPRCGKHNKRMILVKPET